MKRILSFLLLCATSTFYACSVNPVTGERELSILSPQGEVQMGEKNYGVYQQQQGGRYVVAPELNLYVNEVGQKLAKLSQRPGLPYEFVVLNNDVPNAWALPGGKIAINRGLLVLLDDEAQLAAVLGHEIVHSAARHAAQQMTRQQAIGIGVMAAGIATSDLEYGQYIGLGLAGGAAVYQARFGRNQELQSDNYGMEYMAAAGYEPQAAVELQQTFLKLSQGKQGSFLDALFASHPPSQERVSRNQAKTETLPKGQRYRERFQRAIAQIKRDQPAYKKHLDAMKAAQAKQLDKAKSLLAQAIAQQPDEALFYNSLGNIQLNEKQYSAAEQSFQKAYSRNPDHFMTSLGLGLAKKALNKPAEAEQMLNKSLKLLPTQIANYHLGELAEYRGDWQNAASYFNKTAQGGGQLGEAANHKLASMQATKGVN